MGACHSVSNKLQAITSSYRQYFSQHRMYVSTQKSMVWCLPFIFGRRTTRGGSRKPLHLPPPAT